MKKYARTLKNRGGFYHGVSYTLVSDKSTPTGLA